MNIDLSKVTKDQLAADLAQAEDRAAHLAHAAQNVDGEAVAIDGCVKALDVLNGKSRRGSGDYLFPPSSYASPVERVLTFLRLRYGVPDPALERDAARAELHQARTELESLRQRLGQITEAVQR